MAEICTDNRFELVEEFKKKLIESTNIETSPEEMKVIDNILFRFWQMGWLESIYRMPLVKESVKTLVRSVGDSASAKAFRNAGRFIQNAIDGEAPEFEKIPSAESEPMCINLNEPIKVKLTDWGKGIYYHRYDRINRMAGREICKPRFPKEDENGYTEFQLWCFIELYGEHMGMTLPNVIEPLEIIYER